MKSLVSVSVALALASLPAVAVAQVTQAYSYDANGRLIGVTTTGSGGTNTAAYAYDDADNRTSRSQTGTTAYAALSRLPVGEDLQPHQALVSPNGRFSLAVRTSGELELWFDQSLAGSMRADRANPPVFTVDDARNARFIRREPNADADPQAYLALDDGGGLSLIHGDASVLLWRSPDASEMEAGQ